MRPFFDEDITIDRSRLIYDDPSLGPCFDEESTELFKARVAAFARWLDGGAWVEPVVSDDV
jgi:hypothetical protein